jgi:hypothetical protein
MNGYFVRKDKAAEADGHERWGVIHNGEFAGFGRHREDAEKACKDLANGAPFWNELLKESAESVGWC